MQGDANVTQLLPNGTSDGIPDAMASIPAGSESDRPAAMPCLPWWRWPLESLRAAFFLMPRVGEAQPTPWQLALSMLLVLALDVGLERLTVVGPAEFLWQNCLNSLWDVLPFLWLGWLALYIERRRSHEAAACPTLHGLASWFALSLWIGFPANVLSTLQNIAWQRGWLPSSFDPLVWGAYLLLSIWVLVALCRLTARYLTSRWLLVGFMAAAMGLFVVRAWHFQDRFWVPDYSAAHDEEKKPAYLHLTQRMFEHQQRLLKTQSEQLLSERPGVIDVYGLVFAPYAGEEVFHRENVMVADVIRQRFDAEGRVLQFLNHAETGYTMLWATPENLQRGITAIAARMDKQHDVLMIYLTSHGAEDAKLVAQNWPLEVDPVTPELLRRALDEAGIRNRVLIVSACYSGGWVAPLAGDATLVMTAADAEHTSFGCGRRSELTYFGRAMFDEQLRRTRSFQAAFDQARIDIERRENEAGKDDGFSNPQISFGPAIAPVLEALARRLDQADLVKTSTRKP